MKPAILFFALLSALAAIALVPRITSRQSAQPRDPGAMRRPASPAAQPDAPAALAPARPSADPTPQFAQTRQWTGRDAEFSREALRPSMAEGVRANYSLILGDLDLTPEEAESLLSLVAEHSLAATTQTEFPPGREPVVHALGKPKSAEERSTEIAAVIGEARRTRFLELERNLAAYAETQEIESLLKLKGVPLSKQEREGLLALVVAHRYRSGTTPPAAVQPSFMESLEARIAGMNEGERHILELAPSVLSSQQVKYLFEQYQYRAEERARVVDLHKKRRAEPLNDHTPGL